MKFVTFIYIYNSDKNWFFYVTFYFNFIAPNDISQNIKWTIHYHSKSGNYIKIMVIY